LSQPLLFPETLQLFNELLFEICHGHPIYTTEVYCDVTYICHHIYIWYECPYNLPVTDEPENEIKKYFLKGDPMKGSIYLLNEDGDLTEMTEEDYSSEQVLQQHLADHPNLLAGDQIDEDEPRKWLFIDGEYGVSDREEGGKRWSLDHLFVDQDGTPTLVETKRSSDTRLRREVVGQMLDYAANGTKYWNVDDIRVSFRERCNELGVDPDERLQEFIDGGLSEDEFWDEVQENLEERNVRLLFVADEIPSELKAIVEFLYENMRDEVEVLAVEVRKYSDQEDKIQTLVPRVHGKSELSRQKRSSSSGRRWTYDKVTNEIDSMFDGQEKKIVNKFHDFARENNRVDYGAGQTPNLSYELHTDHDLIKAYKLYDIRNFSVYHRLKSANNRDVPEDAVKAADKFLDRCKEIGVTVEEEGVDIFEVFPPGNPDKIEEFFAAVKELQEKVE
jgi:hypothetical protein